MNELIKVSYEKENPTVSGRELHQVLEVETPYTIWFPRMCEYGFTEGKDYVTILLDRSDGMPGKPLTDHAMTIQMAKEICMIQRSDKGKQARQYFLKLEEAWNTPEMIMSRALRMAENTINSLKVESAKKDEEIAVLAPKAEFFDTVADSKTAIDMAQAAKVLNMGIGRNDLFAFLRNEKILMNDNTPYQTYIDRGYFRTIEQKYSKPDGSIHISIKTLVYQRGLDFICRLYISKGGNKIAKAN